MINRRSGHTSNRASECYLVVPLSYDETRPTAERDGPMSSGRTRGMSRSVKEVNDRVLPLWSCPVGNRGGSECQC